MIVGVLPGQEGRARRAAQRIGNERLVETHAPGDEVRRNVRQETDIQRVIERRAVQIVGHQDHDVGFARDCSNRACGMRE